MQRGERLVYRGRMVNCLAALVAAALSDGGRGDAAVVEVSSRAARDDELALRELFATSRCPHVYLDVGSNIGVQIRKLYQPELYPRSPVLRLFRANFGTDRCGVCAVGFEANRRHTQRLHTLQSRLRAAGAGVHVYVPAAAGSSDGISRFTFDQNNTCDTSTARIDCDTEGGSSAAPTATARNRPTAVLRTDVVRSIDLARILLLIDELMRAAAAAQARPQRGRLVMKLDVEGTEFALLPHLLATQALCVRGGPAPPPCNALVTSDETDAMAACVVGCVCSTGGGRRLHRVARRGDLGRGDERVGRAARALSDGGAADGRHGRLPQGAHAQLARPLARCVCEPCPRARGRAARLPYATGGPR